MKYYKVKIGNDIIGVGSSLDFRTYQHKHQILIATTEENGQYIQLGEKLYHDNWMKLINDNPLEYINANVVEIKNKEYDILREAVETDEIVQEPITPQIIQEPIIKKHEDIEYVRSMKIKELNIACQQAIISGFDHNGYHYSMAIEDQMELQFQYQNALSKGVCEYHADDEAYRKYSTEEISTLYDLMNKHKRTHRVHFNYLKQYVNSLTTIEDISKVRYEL